MRGLRRIFRRASKERGAWSIASGSASTRRSGWRRAGTVMLVVLLVMVLSAGAAVGVLWWRGEASLDRISVRGLADSVAGRVNPDRLGATEAETSGDGEGGQAFDEEMTTAGEGAGTADLRQPFTVLVTGIDGDTSGLTSEERARVALGGDREGQRPDTIILVRVEPATDQVAMLSLPRDLLVRRCDGSLGKINGAYNIGVESGTGGPSCLVQTVTRHTGIAIQHYAEVSFAGFIDVVEAVGGVRMYIPDRLVAPKAKLDLQPGCQVLDGPTALAYVRGRNPIGNDFARMARQQVFAEELLEEVTSAGTLANPLRLYRLVESAAGAVDVSDNLGLTDMRQIAESLGNLDSDRLATVSITGAITVREDLGGASVVEEDRSQTTAIYRAFRQGQLTEGLPTAEPSATEAEPTPTPAPTTPIVAAEDVPLLRVLNGVGTAGLASEARQLLQERGFAVGEVADARFRHTRSVVQYGAGMESEAETVAQALGGIPTRERFDLRGAGSPEGGQVWVVIGDDLEALDAPDVRGTPPPSEDPSAAASEGASAGATPTPVPTDPDPRYLGVPTDEESC